MLWETRRSLFKAGVAGAALAALAALLSPVRFTSTARLMPPDAATWQQVAALNMLGNLMGVSSAPSPDNRMFGQDPMTLARHEGLFVGILSSETVQNDLIQKFDLRKIYGCGTRAEARRQLSRRTSILEDRKNGILTIHVTDHERRRAMEIVQEYVSQLNKVLADMNISPAHRERIFLLDRLQQVNGELENAETELAQFLSANSALDPGERAKAVIKIVAALSGQLADQEAHLEALRQPYEDNNIRIQTERSKIDELKRQIQSLEGDARQLGAGSVPGLDRNFALRSLPLAARPYAALYRRVKLDEAVYEAFSLRYEAAKVEEAKEIPSVTVLDGPEIPEERVFPQRVLMVVTGFCLGLLFRVVWIFLRDDWERLDSQDPGKLLASNVYRELRQYATPLRAPVTSGLRLLKARLFQTNLSA
jgi:uncharacterized protein involved in exopolysaccharide biosynthesis